MILLLGLLFFFGAALASFAGVVAEHIGTGTSWRKGRSRCNACTEILGAFDLVPVLSYLWHRGRCRHCNAKVTLFYPISEAVLGAVYVLGYFQFGLSVSFVLFLAAMFILDIIVLYDLRHTIVPFKLSLLFVVLSAVISLSAYGPAAGKYFLLSALMALFFFGLHAVSKGRWMGLGDTPIALGLSFITGPQAISGLLFSFWSGAVIGIGILVMTPPGRRMGIEVPFVPYLAFGYLLALITQWNPFTVL